MARKLDSGDDQERLLSADEPPPGSRRELGRRSYMRLGATAVAALSVPPVAGTGSPRRHGIEFDRTLDAVDDLGMDPTGGDAVDVTQADDGTLLTFPEGRYRFDLGGVSLDGGIRGFEGTGEDVTFLAPGECLLELSGMDAAYVGGIDIDTAGGETGLGLSGGRVVVEDVGSLHRGHPEAAAGDGTRSLVVRGPDTGYEFTVDGRIETDGAGYPQSGTNAEGVVGSGTDRYTIAGEITDLRLDGGGAVYLDGRQVDPARFGSGYPHELAFGPGGSATFSVTALPPWEPGTGERTVAGTADSYRFGGAVESLATRGRVTVTFGCRGRN